MLFTLTNARSSSVEIVEAGAAIRSVQFAGRDGRLANIVLSLPTAEAYADNPEHLGAVVGRFANRIGQARYSDGAHIVHLLANDGPHMLHGGAEGFSTRRWAGETLSVDGADAVRLTLVSADGDGGFPGEVEVTVTYTLSDADELIVDFAATTTAPTPFNIVQHSYWNLSGVPGTTIDDHQLSVSADAYLPVDPDLIPTGDVHDVTGTAFDLREPAMLGAHLAAHRNALSGAGGFDHNLVLNGAGLRIIASLTHPASGRRLTVSNDQPGLHIYTGQFLGASGPLPFSGVALETQAFPDSPNHPHFPDTMLRPGAPFRSRTVFALSVI